MRIQCATTCVSFRNCFTVALFFLYIGVTLKPLTKSSILHSNNDTHMFTCIDALDDSTGTVVCIMVYANVFLFGAHNAHKFSSLAACLSVLQAAVAAAAAV